MIFRVTAIPIGTGGIIRVEFNIEDEHKFSTTFEMRRKHYFAFRTLIKFGSMGGPCALELVEDPSLTKPTG